MKTLINKVITSMKFENYGSLYLLIGGCLFLVLCGFGGGDVCNGIPRC